MTDAEKLESDRRQMKARLATIERTEVSTRPTNGEPPRVQLANRDFQNVNNPFQGGE